MVKTKRKPKTPTVDRFDSHTILENSEDLDKIYSVFGVNDMEDIGGILSGSVGMNEYD